MDILFYWIQLSNPIILSFTHTHTQTISNPHMIRTIQQYNMTHTIHEHLQYITFFTQNNMYCDAD